MKYSNIVNHVNHDFLKFLQRGLQSEPFNYFVLIIKANEIAISQLPKYSTLE